MFERDKELYVGLLRKLILWEKKANKQPKVTIEMSLSSEQNLLNERFDSNEMFIQFWLNANYIFRLNDYLFQCYN